MNETEELQLVRALVELWPASRFPIGFERGWSKHFGRYAVVGVIDALRGVKMQSDPFLPTWEAVSQMLAEMKVYPVGGEDDWRARANREVREHSDRIQAEHDADDALVKQLGADQFKRIADAVLSDGTIEIDVAKFIRERKTPQRDQRIVIGAVAKRARDLCLLESLVV